MEGAHSRSDAVDVAEEAVASGDHPDPPRVSVAAQVGHRRLGPPPTLRPRPNGAAHTALRMRGRCAPTRTCARNAAPHSARSRAERAPDDRSDPPCTPSAAWVALPRSSRADSRQCVIAHARRTCHCAAAAALSTPRSPTHLDEVAVPEPLADLPEQDLDGLAGLAKRAEDEPHRAPVLREPALHRAHLAGRCPAVVAVHLARRVGVVVVCVCVFYSRGRLTKSKMRRARFLFQLLSRHPTDRDLSATKKSARLRLGFTASFTVVLFLSFLVRNPSANHLRGLSSDPSAELPPASVVDAGSNSALFFSFVFV